MDIKELLETSLTARDQEIAEYQFNIDNFEAAIILAEKDDELGDYTKNLKELLRTSKLEMKKSIIMRDVIKGRLDNEI